MSQRHRRVTNMLIHRDAEPLKTQSVYFSPSRVLKGLSVTTCKKHKEESLMLSRTRVDVSTDPNLHVHVAGASATSEGYPPSALPTQIGQREPTVPTRTSTALPSETLPGPSSKASASRGKLAALFVTDLNLLFPRFLPPPPFSSLSC